jgi:hypothetical protein
MPECPCRGANKECFRCNGLGVYPGPEEPRTAFRLLSRQEKRKAARLAKWVKARAERATDKSKRGP